MTKKLQSRIASALRRAPAPTDMLRPAQKKEGGPRRAARAAGFKRARLCRDGAPPTDCIAVECDAFGARLRFAGAAAPPAVTTIIIPSLGLRRKARLCWMAGRDAGFEFLNP
jgi:hypothetical protein